MFLPISFARAKEVGERKRAKGVPLDPLRRSRFKCAHGKYSQLKRDIRPPKVGRSDCEGKRTFCFGLRVMVDGLYGLNSDYIEGLV